MVDAINRLRAAIATLLRAMADSVEPERPIVLGHIIFEPSNLKPGEPVPRLPDHLLDWPGKAEGKPEPPIIWFRGERDLPLAQVECRAKLDGTLPPGCMLRHREEDR